MEVFKILIRTSLIPIFGTATSCSQMPGSGFALTSAFIFIFKSSRKTVGFEVFGILYLVFGLLLSKH